MRALTVPTIWSDLIGYRQLLLSLAWRDIRVRYKQSVLGIAWAVLLPLSMMLVFTFVFTRAIDTSSVLKIQMPYALYAYTGAIHLLLMLYVIARTFRRASVPDEHHISFSDALATAHTASHVYEEEIQHQAEEEAGHNPG